MTPQLFLEIAVEPALRLLPLKMNSPSAKAMMVAIALQESRLEHRAQIGGPAHGFLQFESGGGVKGVLGHAASRPYILVVIEALQYDADQRVCYDAIVHNDVLACAFARLLLWTHPRALPIRADPDGAWHYYIFCWRPGRPHRESWDAFYEQAWNLVEP